LHFYELKDPPFKSPPCTESFCLAISSSVAIHEYGTNILKYNYDPLAVIETKFAMTQGKKDCGSKDNTDKNCDEYPTKVMSHVNKMRHLFQPILALGQGLRRLLKLSGQVRKTMLG
jgi:hypothetical protein